MCYWFSAIVANFSPIIKPTNYFNNLGKIEGRNRKLRYLLYSSKRHHQRTIQSSVHATTKLQLNLINSPLKINTLNKPRTYSPSGQDKNSTYPKLRTNCWSSLRGFAASSRAWFEMFYQIINEVWSKKIRKKYVGYIKYKMNLQKVCIAT